MTEKQNQLASLFAACWKDEALKARLMADPKAVVAEYDMPVGVHDFLTATTAPEPSPTPDRHSETATATP